MPWHEGEDKIHRLTHLPASDNPTHSMLVGALARRVTLSPTIALGAIDKQDRIWCTIWGGDIPIAQQVARGVIGIRTQVDASFDPVVEALYGGQSDGEVVRDNKMVSALSINLEERDRVKMFGQMMAGSLNADDSSSGSMADHESNKVGRTGNAQLVVQISQSLGNCPKYLNKKAIKSYTSAKPRLISNSPVLSTDAIDHIHSADIFFIASRGPEDMDCNHRGGSPGFIRVIQTQKGTEPSDSSNLPAETGSALVWPEYSGNNLYQTLGNLTYTPRAGIVIPNFTTGTVLYMSGTTEVLIGAAASKVLTKTKLAIRFTITAARFVSDGLSFRGIPSTNNSDVSSSKPRVDRTINDGMSPYNPKIRYLVSELPEDNKSKRIETVPPDEYADRTVEAWRNRDEGMSATLIKKDKLTSTITKYRFRIGNAKIEEGNPPLWMPGQYVALDFSDELYTGYSHMRDDNPGSLNDDFIRTFTVASAWTAGKIGSQSQVEFEIIVRNVGAVTKWLSWQNDRSGMTKIGVRGFSGDFRFEIFEPESESKSENEVGKGRRKNAFVAAGIGITPLLGQLELVRDGGMEVLWTLHVRDIGLVEEVVRTFEKASAFEMKIFITGTTDLSNEDEYVQRLQKIESGLASKAIQIERRRMNKADLQSVEQDGSISVDKWYLCTAPKMRAEIQEWLDGRTVVFENFDY